MRKMKKGNTILNIVSHIMTKNFWEYYITDEKYSEDIVCALVDGFEQEIGDVSLSEIKPYMMCKTNNLNDLQAAPGWTWV